MTQPTDTQVSSPSIDPRVRPTDVKIGAHRYAIQYDHPIVMNGDQMNGWCDFPNSVIKVDDGRTASMMAETMLHEILHAIDVDRRLDMTEHQVDQTAAGMMGVFADNPDLVVVLLNAVCGKVDGS